MVVDQNGIHRGGRQDGVVASSRLPKSSTAAAPTDGKGLDQELAYAASCETYELLVHGRANSIRDGRWRMQHFVLDRHGDGQVVHVL